MSDSCWPTMFPSSRLLLLTFATFAALLQRQDVTAVPRSFSCMSYMEDEKFLQDDYDSSSDEIVMSYTSSDIVQTKNDFGNGNEENLAENSLKFDASRQQVRVCQADYTFCFTLWRQNSNGIKIEKQGCWKESTEQNATCSQHECTSSAPTSRNNTLYYCCCSGDVCNEHVSIVEPAPLQLAKEIAYGTQRDINGTRFLQRHELVLSNIFLICALALFGIAISGLAAFLYRHKLFQKPAPEEAPLAPSGPGYSSNLRNVDNLNLICMLGSGKFGTVMKGLLHDQEVAVKIYSEMHHQYYINERNIYTLPFMDCPALLKYLGYDERQTIDGQMEYQLVLSLAPLGCLQDYIIANVLDFETFCSMAKSITRGLSHLHTEIRVGDECKPCVAHRDLNSRNILVKADRSCCISDFGFALKVFGAKYEYKGEVAIAETKSINEVGTLRYMAPELLEGAVNLRDCETSLKQMDVYALSLVLWEVASRCADFYPSAHLVLPYKAPYEAEVGPHPNFELMQAYVVRRKARPLFPTSWSSNAAAKLVKDTCEDCWDHDAEARLTSLCAEERMHEVAILRSRRAHFVHAVTPFLNANDLTGMGSGSSNSSAAAAAAASQHESIKIHYAAGRDEVISSNASAVTAAAASAVLQPPPNQQVSTQMREPPPPQLEKNHLISSQHPQPQVQPYNGRNPCQARNLAPVTVRAPQRLVEKSKKHSFQSKDEHSLSCIEDDVSVEELIVGMRNDNGYMMTTDSDGTQRTTNMGQGFPKQHNTDKTLSGWHGVRALIQKKLFRVDMMNGGGDIAALNTLNIPHNNAINANPSDEHSDDSSRLNLVNNHSGIKGKSQNSLEKYNRNINSLGLSMMMPNASNSSSTAATAASHNNRATQNRRPNNLDLSPINDLYDMQPAAIVNNLSTRSQQSIHTIVEEAAAQGDEHQETKRSFNKRNSFTPPPSSLQDHNSNTSKYNNTLRHSYDNNSSYNSMLFNGNAKHISDSSLMHKGGGYPGRYQEEEEEQQQQQVNQYGSNFKRQRSLEVFREVFSGRGSTDRLRDPSQRVKTPGDVPPSVRKVRASKTLSLYDDRMMDSSTLNIL